MNLSAILKKTWQMLWNYRALWLFGAVLALVGVNSIYPGPWTDREIENDEWIEIKFSDTFIVHVPGADMTIDFTAPEDSRIIIPDSVSWQEFRQLADELNREEQINLWPILIELVVILAGALLLGTMARYITETALIRMVDVTEATGRRQSVWEGLRSGLSFRAWRLFLLDLIVGLFAGLAFLVVFGLAIAPMLLVIGSGDAVLITVGFGTLGLLTLATYLWLAAGAFLSLALQPIRRACVLEKQSFLASIRQGGRLIRRHLKEVGLVWVIWMGIRLLWMPVAGLVLVLLSPLILLMIPPGIGLGGVPAALVAAIAALWMDGATPWIMGALAGIPFFIVVMILPMLFVSGLVEVYKSCLWTLAYRDLRAMDLPVEAPAPQPQAVTAPGAAD